MSVPSELEKKYLKALGYIKPSNISAENRKLIKKLIDAHIPSKDVKSKAAAINYSSLPNKRTKNRQSKADFIDSLLKEKARELGYPVDDDAVESRLVITSEPFNDESSEEELLYDAEIIPDVDEEEEFLPSNDRIIKSNPNVDLSDLIYQIMNEEIDVVEKPESVERTGRRIM